METLTTSEASASDHAGRSRRWFLAVVAALVLLGIAGGLWAVLQTDQTDDQMVATELVDTWARGVSEHDADVVRSVFTSDAAIPTVDPDTRNVRRVGELTPTSEDGVFIVVFESDWGSRRYSTEWEVELEGDLLARAEPLSITSIDT